MTEMTEQTERMVGSEFRGEIFYDSQCKFCIGLAERFGPMLSRRGYRMTPLQQSGVAERTGLAEDELMREMKMRLPAGQMVGGADALLKIGLSFWWSAPIAALGYLPGVNGALHAGYRAVAARRYCFGRVCPIEAKPWWPGVLPLALLGAIALPLRGSLAPWAYMWTVCFAIFFGLKWLSWWRLARRGARASKRRIAAYVALWPGMDPEEFLFEKKRALPATRKQFAAAIGKIAFGAVLVWMVTRLVPHPVLAAWTGMIGGIFMLHFGSFHLIALLWNRVGVRATPIMNAPILATSLAEFWSLRWNLAFRDLVNPFLFRPISARWGTAAGVMVTFIASGLVHELAISLPARGGYGLPTLYFATQGAGLLFERTRFARNLGLRRGKRGWAFTMLATAACVPLLFHAPFVERVILPFLDAIGAR